MKKFKKMVLISGLALTVVAAPVTLTEPSSAAEVNSTVSTAGELINTVNFGLIKNKFLDLYGFTTVEIRSGNNVVKMVGEKRVQAINSGNAVVYAYDIKGNYVIYNINVK
ncbi:hypothetical protein [Lysinibacillus sp. NPDC086135]|uniref:hypothetical protein n=1 Tax=Lysinibacillus sp. NPDC086135 TaxID=3364130 RepID=UPI00381EF03D